MLIATWFRRGRNVGSLIDGHADTPGTRPCRRPKSAARFSSCGGVASDYANVLRFLTFAAGGHVELNVLALFEGLVAAALDVGEVDENVVTLLPRNEAEAL